MRRRLTVAVEAVPELGEFAEGLGRTFDALAAYDEPVPVQRIHSDFDPGQVLRAPSTSGS